MRTDLTSENMFQNDLIQILEVRGHVQRHNFSHYPDVPDLSLAYCGDEYWMELKYQIFRFGREKYDRFHFDETTRGQLKWLVDRATHSRCICGVLGYWKAKESAATAYLSWIPPQYYVNCLWKDTQWTSGAALLADWTTQAGWIKSAGDLCNFIKDAARSWTRYNS